MMRLDSNENLKGPSPKVLDALRRTRLKQLARYPCCEALSAALARKLGIETGRLLVSAGADEALALAFAELTQGGDKVVLLDPTFSEYDAFARGRSVQRISCGKRFPSEELLAAVDATMRLVVIATPNNPTGTLAPPETLQAVAQRLEGGYLLIDEAYIEFARRDNAGWALDCDNVFLVRTFSKAYGLAGLRVGYVAGPEPVILALCKRQLPYGVNGFGVTAALAALSDEPYVASYAAEVAEGRVRLIEVLDADVWPSSANFLWADFGERSDAIEARLLAAGISVRRFGAWPTFLRITVGTRAGVDRVIQALTEPQLILFDMDGVLVDESRSYRVCIRETVKALEGAAPPPERVEALKAAGGVNDDYDCVAALLTRPVARADIVSCFDRLYWGGLVNNEGWILPAKTLSRLRERYRLRVVTGRPRRDAEAALERFGMQGYFDVVVTADDVAEGKPSPDGLLMALQGTPPDLAVYVGDLPDDRSAAEAAGVAFVEDVSQLLAEQRRETSVSRVTSETAIDIELELDGSGETSVDTGLGFFDHMLISFAKHGLFDLQLACRGDLEVDEHHTVEDVGIAIGQALNSALGDKLGIARAGFFLFPMDGATGSCAVDLSVM